LLISGVVLSHLLVLLGLLSIPLGSEKSPTQEVLMVSLMGDRAKSSVMKKSIVTPQIISFSGKENQSLMEAGGISSLIGIEGASRLTEGTARQAIHSPKPHYPLASRQLREQGLVIVKLCVNEQGVVGEAGISKSSGFQNLDHSALKTLVQWRFSEISSSSSGLFPQCFQTPIQFTLEG
jgi:TonB family protein